MEPGFDASDAERDEIERNLLRQVSLAFGCALQARASSPAECGSAESSSATSHDAEQQEARIALRRRVMVLLADVLAAHDALVPLLVELNHLDVLCDDTPFVRGWLDTVDGVIALIDEQVHHYGSVGPHGRGGLTPLRLALARKAATAGGMDA